MIKRRNNDQLIVFKKDPSKISAIRAYMAATIEQPRWDLCSGRYALWGFREQALANNIIEVDVEELSLKNNQIPLLRQIQTINFKHMKKIILDGNNIDSIQNISNLSATSLLSISLNENHIVCIKSLRKSQFLELREISLSLFNNILEQNRIEQLSGIQHWNFPKLCELSLESAQDHVNQGQNLMTLCKLSSLDMQWIFATSLRRIQEKDSIIIRKWPKCEVRGKLGRRRGYNIVTNNYYL